jgi:2-oxoglutarate dehydrogenase E1 component
MDRFSFLKAHTFFAQLYDQYTENPDSVEASWRSFFQGFDFGQASYNGQDPVTHIANVASGAVQSTDLAKLQKKFDVLKLIEGYRVRGHLFTKTNPVRDRRTLSNTRYRKFRTFICRSWDRFLMPLE